MTEQELLGIFDELIEVYRLKGKRESYTTIKTGNINDTFVLQNRLEDGSERQYTIQRINHAVFRNPEEVAENANAVTAHIERKMRAMQESDIRRRVLRYYRMENGKFFYNRKDGSYWRVFSFVYDALNTSSASNEILYGTGVAFGKFQRYLSDFPADTLYVTIPDFHNTPKRFADLSLSAEADPCGRVSEVQKELNYLSGMRRKATLFDDLHRQGVMPLRVVHNDTKCNNVMFDRKTNRPLAVIDLDTVMPGYVAYDFGDAVRFACNTAAEDEADVSRVSLDLEGFSHFASGFIGQLGGIMTESELDHLSDGVLLITLELATRFLKDYIDGDVYFKCRVEKHNLIRARCQIALARDITRKLPQMRQMIRGIAMQKNKKILET